MRNDPLIILDTPSPRLTFAILMAGLAVLGGTVYGAWLMPSTSRPNPANLAPSVHSRQDQRSVGSLNAEQAVMTRDSGQLFSPERLTGLQNAAYSSNRIWTEVVLAKTLPENSKRLTLGVSPLVQDIQDQKGQSLALLVSSWSAPTSQSPEHILSSMVLSPEISKLSLVKEGSHHWRAEYTYRGSAPAVTLYRGGYSLTIIDYTADAKISTALKMESMKVNK